MVSPVQASIERNRRISEFKQRVAALRATSKAYHLACDKSVNTLDSSTLASVSTGCSGSSSHVGETIRSSENVHGSETLTAGVETTGQCIGKNPFGGDDDDDDSSYVSSVDGNDSSAAASLLSSGLAKGETGRVNLAHLEKRDAAEEERAAESNLDSPRVMKSPLHNDMSKREMNAQDCNVGTSAAAVEKKNPFYDSDDNDDDEEEEKEEENDALHRNTSDFNRGNAMRMNRDACPNPFEDSSIDDSDDTESFIGVLNANNVQQLSLKKKYNGSNSASSSNTIGSADGTVSNASVGSSIDGALFNGLQELIAGSKRKGGDQNAEKTTGKSRETSPETPMKQTEQRPASVQHQVEKKNPFFDSDDEEESQDRAGKSNGEERAEMNYDASPNPFEDSSIDGDDDDDSFEGFLRANKVQQQIAKNDHHGSKSVSSSTTTDSVDGNFSNASVESSVDGALFSGFQEFMAGGKKMDKGTTTQREDTDDSTNLTSQETTPVNNNVKKAKHKAGSSVSWNDKKSVASYSSSSFSGFSIETIDSNAEGYTAAVVPPKQEAMTTAAQAKSPMNSSQVKNDTNTGQNGQKKEGMLLISAAVPSPASTDDAKADEANDVNNAETTSTLVKSTGPTPVVASRGGKHDAIKQDVYEAQMKDENHGEMKPKTRKKNQDNHEKRKKSKAEKADKESSYIMKAAVPTSAAAPPTNMDFEAASMVVKTTAPAPVASCKSGTTDASTQDVLEHQLKGGKHGEVNAGNKKKSAKKGQDGKKGKPGKADKESLSPKLAVEQTHATTAAVAATMDEGADANNCETSSTEVKVSAPTPGAPSQSGTIDASPHDIPAAELKDENHGEVKPEKRKKSVKKGQDGKKGKAGKADKEASLLTSTKVPIPAAPAAAARMDECTDVNNCETSPTEVKITAPTPVALSKSGTIDASPHDIPAAQLKNENHGEMKPETRKKSVKKSQNGKKGKEGTADKEASLLTSTKVSTPSAAKMGEGADANNCETASTVVKTTAPTPVAPSKNGTIDASTQDVPAARLKDGNHGEAKPENRKKSVKKGQNGKKGKEGKADKEASLLASTKVSTPAAATKMDEFTDTNNVDTSSPKPVAVSKSGTIDTRKRDASKTHEEIGIAERSNTKDQQTALVANGNNVEMQNEGAVANVAEQKDKREPQVKASKVRAKSSKQVEHGKTNNAESTVSKVLPAAGKESCKEHEEKTADVKIREASRNNIAMLSESVSSPRSESGPINEESKKMCKATNQTKRVTTVENPLATKKKWKIDVDSLESSSTGFSFDPAFPTPVKENKFMSSNPFADILALRDRERKANSMVVGKLMERTSGISEMNLESSSQETDSEAFSALEQDRKVVLENTRKINSNPFNDDYSMGKPVVDYDDTQSDSSNEESSEESTSLEGVLFTDLQKALSKIQSVSYEATDEESDGETLDTRDQPEIIVPTGESCAVSSLKDADFKDAENPAGFDENESFDSGEDIASVPKSPAPLESENDDDATSVSQSNESSDQSENSDEENDGESEYLEEETTHNDETEKALNVSDNTVESSQTSKEKEVLSAPISDSVTTERPNVRSTNLCPPKNSVVLRDGSISTKDSIVGKTIRVTNADMVAERIYLESLRAQVHAELKVHVADEEIRLALEARLQAIRNFYKKKATVSRLKSSHDDDFLEKVASLSSQQKSIPSSTKPKILRNESVDKSIQAPLSPVSSVSYPNGVTMRRNEDIGTGAIQNAQQVKPSPTATSPTDSYQKGVTMNSSTKNTQKFAFERAQANIDQAIKAAHLTLSQQSASDECKGNDDENEEDEFVNIINAETTIPSDIFTQDTFWDEEEGIIPPSPLAKPQIGMISPTVQNAWNFYRELNNLLSDSRMYDYEFQVIQEDPLYPYVNSLVGIADTGDDGKSKADKEVKQEAREEYKNKSPHRVCHMLTKEAKIVQPELIELCADIGRKLDMKTMAVGPIKTASAALIKCEKKYGGNPLLVTDYCRVSLFVPDIATLLALIEIILSKYAYLVKRIKLSNLKNDHSPIIGGYRDCKINVDIDGHICEIQVHLEAMWNLKEEKGYSHYKRCFENNVNLSTFDISRTLTGLDREFLSDLIKVGEDAVESIPVTSLKHYSEGQIRDYSALASLYLYYGLPVRAEYTLRQIVKLRTESVNFGPGHAETVMHLKLLRKSLKMQHKYKSASAITKRITRAEKGKNGDDDVVELCTQDKCGVVDQVCDSILDPSKKEREHEKKKAQRVEDSRAIWLGVRKTFFKQ